MTISPPPITTWWPTEQRAPGVYSWFAKTVQASHAGLGGVARVESWYRDPIRNAQVGGLPDSQHQLGLAVDLSYENAAFGSIAAGRMRARGMVVTGERFSPVTGRFLLHAQAWPAGLARASSVLGGVGL